MIMVEPQENSQSIRRVQLRFTARDVAHMTPGYGALIVAAHYTHSETYSISPSTNANALSLKQSDK